MNESIELTPITVEAVDRAVRDWFDKTVNARVQSATGLAKVPVHFSTGERWAVGRTRQGFRDETGLLILPIIAVRRVAIDPDPTKLALGVQTNNIQIARRVDPKTNDLKNLEPGKSPSDRRNWPPIYDIYTIPFPDRLVSNYQIIVQAQYMIQMNEILQKIWKSLDIQRSFVAPLDNDGRQPPRSNQYGEANPYESPAPLSTPYVVGFLESPNGAADNIEEFTDTERIVKYTTECSVPFASIGNADGKPPVVQVQRTAYKVVVKDENYHFVDDPAELDDIFGTLK